ncbi:MAG: isoaspartyl peptidase/L-asparaginase [Chloroflexi bacterium]|nr:isoaspartyl peptidase/L-asparaginase [Chloroflexota bacterium]
MNLVAGDHKNSGTQVSWNLLQNGTPALMALEQGVRAVEANVEDWSVGVGGFPNALGMVELDAGVMDGRTRASGAVGALQGFIHPVSVAHAVMRLLPHVLLVGEGAAKFAHEIGAERGDLLTPDMRDKWRFWCREHDFHPERGDHLTDVVFRGRDPQRTGGTTVYLAQDSYGDIAVATSTSGWAWKHPGRLGDTPIAGAGFFADNRYGAAACTGLGEIAIRSSMARMVVAFMQMGRTVEEAVREALADICYHGDQTTGITVYAIDNQGGHFVGYSYPPEHERPTYYAASDGDIAPTRRDPVDLTAADDKTTT